MDLWHRQLAVALALASAASGSAQAQISELGGGEGACDPVEVTIRLRRSHPLGAAQFGERQCLVRSARWVGTIPMEQHQRLAWRRAIAQLAASPVPACALAARTLVWLEQTGAVSVWAPADTAAGNVYFGAT